MSSYIESVVRLWRRDRRRTAGAPPRGRRSTFQPVRDDSMRGARWAPLG
jgi:hypothetical protein